MTIKILLFVGADGYKDTVVCRCRGVRPSDSFTLLYPGLIPVDSVSWMLLSSGAKLEPRSGLGDEG
jgi:hypothetical protein